MNSSANMAVTKTIYFAAFNYAKKKKKIGKIQGCNLSNGKKKDIYYLLHNIKL